MFLSDLKRLRGLAASVEPVTKRPKPEPQPKGPKKPRKKRKEFESTYDSGNIDMEDMRRRAHGLTPMVHSLVSFPPLTPAGEVKEFMLRLQVAQEAIQDQFGFLPRSCTLTRETPHTSKMLRRMMKQDFEYITYAVSEEDRDDDPDRDATIRCQSMGTRGEGHPRLYLGACQAGLLKQFRRLVGANFYAEVDYWYTLGEEVYIEKLKLVGREDKYVNSLFPPGLRYTWHLLRLAFRHGQDKFLVLSRGGGVLTGRERMVQMYGVDSPYCRYPEFWLHVWSMGIKLHQHSVNEDIQAVACMIDDKVALQRWLDRTNKYDTKMHSYFEEHGVAPQARIVSLFGPNSPYLPFAKFWCHMLRYSLQDVVVVPTVDIELIAVGIEDRRELGKWLGRMRLYDERYRMLYDSLGITSAEDRLERMYGPGNPYMEYPEFWLRVMHDNLVECVGSFTYRYGPLTPKNTTFMLETFRGAQELRQWLLHDVAHLGGFNLAFESKYHCPPRPGAHDEVDAWVWSETDPRSVLRTKIETCHGVVTDPLARMVHVFGQEGCVAPHHERYAPLWVQVFDECPEEIEHMYELSLLAVEHDVELAAGEKNMGDYIFRQTVGLRTRDALPSQYPYWSEFMRVYYPRELALDNIDEEVIRAHYSFFLREKNKKFFQQALFSFI